MASSLTVVLLCCCIYAGSCAVSSCNIDSDCSNSQKCVKLSNNERGEFELCSRGSTCRCETVCENNGKLVTHYMDKCNRCNCFNPELNLFGCTRMLCLDRPLKV